MKLKKTTLPLTLGLLTVGILFVLGYAVVGVTAALPELPTPSGGILLGVQDNGQTVELSEGEVLVIELDSNPSTGYIWSPQDLDEAVLRQRNESQFRPESDLFGAPAKQVLEFEAIAAEPTTLDLVYQRPWEKQMQGQSAPTFSISVQGIGSFAAAPEPTFTPTPELRSIDNVSAVDEASSLALPSSFNWCNEVGCTAVRDQGSCGSCWAFATAGLLEAKIRLQDGVSRNLAEQYLLSCNTDGWSCSGGWWAHDYHLSKIPSGEPAAGAVYESDFPYVASKDPPYCNPPHTHHEKIASWQYVGSSGGIASTSAIKQAIYTYGPVASGICAETLFSAYTGGVFSQGDSCTGYGDNVNHAVILVGWDDTQGIWRLRNSWGADWGESGYMRIQYGVANVGYSANYVTYASSNPTSTPTRTPTRTSTPTPTRPPGTMFPHAYLPHIEQNSKSLPTSTPTPTTPSPQSAELLQNRGFESGATVWEQYSKGDFQCIVEDEFPHAGSWSAWLGGYEDADDWVRQTFTVPSWARSARLQFYLYVYSDDFSYAPFDFFYGKLQTAAGSTLQQFMTADNTWESSDWYLVTQDWNDFTAHAGAQRRLLFQGTTDSSFNTNFFIDDVSFVVYSSALPGASDTPTIELQEQSDMPQRAVRRKP